MTTDRPLRTAMLALLAALSALPIRAACAADKDESIYGAFGPFGASIGYEHRFGTFGNGHWGSRVLVNTGNFGGAKQPGGDDELSGNRYEQRLKVGAGISTLLDYYPSLDSGWRITGGLILSRIKTDLTGRPDAQGNYNFHGHSYNATQVGALTGQLKYDPVLLYAGGGWESAAAGARGWRFVSDAGVFVTGRAKTTLNASNAAGNAALQADLNAARGDLSKRGLGLVLQMGAAYAF